jgi:hypothetical protein
VRAIVEDPSPALCINNAQCRLRCRARRSAGLVIDRPVGGNMERSLHLDLCVLPGSC